MDVATMCSNMNVVNNCNAKTTNVLDNLNQCKYFINLETDASITAATLLHFGMKSVDDEEQEVIPPNVLASSNDNKRLWFHKQVKKIVSKHVMNSETEIYKTMTEAIRLENSTRGRDEYRCRICDKVYRYKKAMETHELKVHNYTHEEIREAPTEKPVKDNKKADHIYNYACVRLSMGLFVRNFDDAVAEGDGARIIRCWKFMTLMYRSQHHTKYAFAGIQLQANLLARCTARQAHRLIWNRTVSTKGGKGNNISLDLRLEHLNNILKGMLRNVGVNLNENTAKRASHSLMFMEKFLRHTDEEMGRNKPSGHHVTAKHKEDFLELVKQFHLKGKVFSIEEGREYNAFPKFDRNILKNMEFSSLNKWINEHKRKLSQME